MVDNVPVEAYGERQPLSAIAQVSLRNATTIVVSPFDAAVRLVWSAWFALQHVNEYNGTKLLRLSHTYTFSTTAACWTYSRCHPRCRSRLEPER